MQSNEKPTDEVVMLPKAHTSETARSVNANASLPQVSVDHSDAKRLYKEILAFYNDRQNRKSEELLLRLTQCSDSIFAIKTLLLDEIDTGSEEFKGLKKLKKQFKHLRDQLQAKEVWDSSKVYQQPDSTSKVSVQIKSNRPALSVIDNSTSNRTYFENEGSSITYELHPDFQFGPHGEKWKKNFMGGLGVVSINSARIYAPALMAFLTCENVPIVDMLDFDENGELVKDREVKIVDGTQYIATYIEGFLEGCTYFEKYYQVSADIEYSEHYINSIKGQFCGNDFDSWMFFYRWEMMSVGYAEVKGFGFRAGILSKVEELAKRNKPIRDALEPYMYYKYSHEAEKYKPGITKGQQNEPKAIPVGKPTNIQQQFGFESYIDEKYKHREELRVYLITNYSNQKPRRIVPMLYALVKVGAIPKTALHSTNQTNLHKALEITFGNIGVRTSLNSALHLYGSDKPLDEHKRQIEQESQQIQAFLGSIDPDN